MNKEAVLYLASLGASNAFDRVNHFQLCQTLMRRHLPVAFLSIIINRYSKLSITLVLGVFIHSHTHTRFPALCPGLPVWAGTRKVKLIWILLKQETVSGSGIRWAIRYDTRCYFNLRSKADISQLNLPHVVFAYPFHFRKSRFSAYFFTPNPDIRILSWFFGAGPYRPLYTV